MSSASLQKRFEKALPSAPRSAEAAVRALELADKQPKDSSRMVVLTRVLNAITEILGRIDSGKVASASSDFEVLLSLLEQPEVLTELKQRDPLAGAKIRGLKREMELLDKEGGCVPASEAAKLLGISRAAIHKARIGQRLLGIPRGQNQFQFPVWQFSRGKILPGLREVYSVLAVNEWMKASFMLSPNTRLGKQTPLSLLRSGEIDSVVRAAQLYGVHGAV
jgi:hypothetical protein